MRTLRAALFAAVAMLLATSAFAQAGPGAGGSVATLGGRATGIGPRTPGPTPLFMLGRVAVGIWTRVPPPYDVTANRTAAANPLP